MISSNGSLSQSLRWFSNCDRTPCLDASDRFPTNGTNPFNALSPCFAVPPQDSGVFARRFQ